MNRRNSVDRGVIVEVADRLAMTSQDRRLESLVLLELMRSAPGGPEPDPRPRSTDSRGCRHDDGDPVEDPTFAHARNIASFLSTEYGLDTLERGMFIAELAVEMAQRMAEGPSGD
jgi:hypothetical protein